MTQVKKIYFLLPVFIFLNYFNNYAQDKAELIEFKSSECSYDYNFEKLQSRILDVKKTDNITIYKVFVITNCAFFEEGSIEIKNDTLHLRSNAKPEIIKSEVTKEVDEKTGDIIESYTVEEVITIAECDCYFEFSYKIKGLSDKKYVIKYDGEEIVESNHKYKIINKQPIFSIVKQDTIGYEDIYGIYHGAYIWNLDGKPYLKVQYVNGERVSGIVSTSYNKFGFDKIELHISKDTYFTRKYYKFGKLVKSCDASSEFEDDKNCVCYNE